MSFFDTRHNESNDMQDDDVMEMMVPENGVNLRYRLEQVDCSLTPNSLKLLFGAHLLLPSFPSWKIFDSSLCLTIKGAIPRFDCYKSSFMLFCDLSCLIVVSVCGLHPSIWKQGPNVQLCFPSPVKFCHTPWISSYVI